MLDDNKNQEEAFTTFGFISSAARRNLIIFIIAASWTMAGYVFWQSKDCELQHRTTIQAQQSELLRLIDKYESKIEKLNSDLNTVKK